MYEPGGAPKQWTVPAQRASSPLTFPTTIPAPETAARGGHHDWGAVVAAFAALFALLMLLGPGTSVADADRAGAGPRVDDVRVQVDPIR